MDKPSRWSLAAVQPTALAAVAGTAACIGLACGIAYHMYVSRIWRVAQLHAPPPVRVGQAHLPLLTGGGSDARTDAIIDATGTAAASSAGQPTVVFVHGMGCSALEWAPVTALLQRRVRWAALDRVLNINERDLAVPRSAEVIVEELREALAFAGIAPPYVLVGHSYGGLIVRAWALRHRADVAALLLIDPLHEAFVEPPTPLDFRLAFKFAVPAVFATLAAAAPFGLARLLNWLGQLGLPPTELLPPAQRAEAVERYSLSASWRIAASELEGSMASLPWVRKLGSLDASLPTTVLVAGRRDKSPTMWPRALTAAFVAQAKDVLGGDGDGSPLRRLVVAAGSEHWVHLCEPALVAREVQRLYEGTDHS